MRLSTLLNTTVRLLTGLCLVRPDQVKAQLVGTGVSRADLWLYFGLLALCVLCVAAGCERESDRENRISPPIERRLGEKLLAELGAEQKSGMLRALEVSSVAHRAADQLRNRPDPRCSIDLPETGAFHYKFELILERRAPRQHEMVARWKEVRTLRRDDRGRLELALDATYQTPLMNPDEIAARRAMRWILVGKQAYISAEWPGIDRPSFYRREAISESYPELLSQGFETLQTLLDALPQGWKGDKSPAQTGSEGWVAGGERLVCAPISGKPGYREGANWLSRLGLQVQSSSGTLRSVEAQDAARPRENSRILQMEWLLADGSTLHADFRDTFRLESEPVEPPSLEQIIDIERDRSLLNAQKLLTDWRERAWIKPMTNIKNP